MKILNIILRYLFSWIDAITAKLITTIYRLLSNLSELVLYSDDMIKVIGKRIGLILGVFMLFKLAVSLINYMISPDKLKDGKQGGGRLIINVGISLFLLISINFIFKEAYRIQGAIVNSKIIERIFFGSSGIIQSTNDNEDNSVKMDIGYYLYTGFIYPNTEVFGDTCDDLWDTRFDITKREANHTQTCDEMLHDKLPDDARKSIYKARNTLDMSYVFFEYDLISSSGTLSDVLDFDYTPIISNAAGIVVLLILISFSMDLATRAVKLLFLQIIAPIPIISFMDVGKGQDVFKKWGKECINTYISVFLRLIAINFAVFMIVLLRGNYKAVFVNNVWLNIFLIIGCLMFAKQIPKLLEDFFGIKSGGMVLNPLKKFEEQALLGKNITGGIAGAAVGTLGMWSTRSPIQGLKGAVSGLVGGKGFKEGWNNQVNANRTFRDARRDGSTFLGRRLTHLDETLGISTRSEDLEARIHRIDERIKEIDNRNKAMKDSISDRQAVSKKVSDIENRADSLLANGKAGDLSNFYDKLKNNIETLKQSGASAVDLAKAEEDFRKFARQAREDIINNAMSIQAGHGVISSRGFTATSDPSLKHGGSKMTKDVDGIVYSGLNDLASMVSDSAHYRDDHNEGFTVSSRTMDSAEHIHDIAGRIDGSVARDTRRVISPADGQKQRLEQRKADLYEAQRAANADKKAIGK